MTQTGSPKILDYVLLITLACIFGFSFLLTKIAVKEIPPSTIAMARLIIAAVILFPVMYWAKQSIMPLLPHWKLILLAGAFGNALPFLLVSWGQVSVDAGLTSILMAVMPLITLVLAHFFTEEERLNRYKIIGFLLGLVGVVMLFGFDKLASLGDDTIRQYAIMGAACCYAIHAILFKGLVNLPRRSVAVAILIVSALMLLPISILVDRPWELSVSSDAWVSLFALGIFPTAIGTLMLFAIIRRQGAAFLSQINYLVPVFGVLWAVLLINEVLPPNALFALLIILAGIAIARIKSTNVQMGQTL